MSTDDRDRQLAEHRRARYEADFDPGYTRENVPTPDARIATAVEHMAFRLGRIDQKLGQIIAALNRGPARS